MNARRAANLSPTKSAYFVSGDEQQMFRWTAADSRLLAFALENDDDVRLLGQVSPDQADEILNMAGWKPADTDGPLRDWMWRAAYVIGRRLRIPGFHKKAPSERGETWSAVLISRSSYPSTQRVRPSSSTDSSGSAGA